MLPAGGGGQIAVTAAAADCAWTAAPGASWITIQGAPGGTGSGPLRFTVAANPNPAPRAGTLVVAGTTVSITQAATPAPPPCTFAISPNPVTVGFAGDGDIDLHVVTTAGCAWTATSQASWITVTGRSSGTGDGHVHIAVAATLLITGRTGTVLVEGQTVTVNQAGILNQEVTFSGTITNLSGSCPNRSFSMSGMTIVANGGTNYPGKDECSDLRDGRAARVRGIGQADGSIRATRIDKIGEGIVGAV